LGDLKKDGEMISKYIVIKETGYENVEKYSQN
jgi:hypothetical protein